MPEVLPQAMWPLLLVDH